MAEDRGSVTIGRSTIRYDEKLTLPAPSGGGLASIRVRVTVEPKDAGMLIYGFEDANTPSIVEVGGGVSEVDLPFISPEILITYIHGLTSQKIEVLSWTDSRR
jgi:hypothetical protein